MTAIVGIVDRKTRTVWMGGDSAGTTASWKSCVRADSKVFRIGEFVFGFAGSFRMGQLIRYFTPPPLKEGQDVYAYLVTAFIPAVRKVLVDGHWLQNKDGQDIGGFFLVGFRGRLFRIESDMQVGEVFDDYVATGCGEQVCCGSLHATKGQQPRARILKALEAAAHHDAGVRPPFVIEKVKAR